MAFDPDPLRIDVRIGFQIVERPARSPTPGAQRTPVVGLLARLPFVQESDDPLGEPRTIVRLHRNRRVQREAPPSREYLLLPLVSGRSQSRQELRIEIGRKLELEFHDDGNGLRQPSGRRERQSNVDVDERIGRVVDSAHERLRRHRNVAVLLGKLSHDLPFDFGCVRRKAPVHLAREIFDDLRASFCPPVFRP